MSLLDKKALKQICDAQSNIIDILNEHLSTKDEFLKLRGEQIDYLYTHIGELNKIIDEYRSLFNSVIINN